MWDGNLSIVAFLTSLYSVEREPMWDGNLSYYEPFLPLEELSENQCGMETDSVKVETVLSDFVEREPMWDGNGLTRMLTRTGFSC